MIQTLIFDFGGVLVKSPNLTWLRCFEGVLGFENDPELKAIFTNPNESQLVREMCLGNLTEDQLIDLVAEKMALRPRTLNRIRKGVFSKRHLNRPLLKFMTGLQSEYQLAILSNAGNQAREIIENHYHLDAYVEEIIISAEEGVIKPDHRIYQIAMDRLKATPETSLFIDDFMVNVFSARDFGMSAVQFINNYQVITAIRDYLETDE